MLNLELALGALHIYIRLTCITTHMYKAQMMIITIIIHAQYTKCWFQSMSDGDKDEHSKHFWKRTVNLCVLYQMVAHSMSLILENQSNTAHRSWFLHRQLWEYDYLTILWYWYVNSDRTTDNALVLMWIVIEQPTMLWYWCVNCETTTIWYNSGTDMWIVRLSHNTLVLISIMKQ